MALEDHLRSPLAELLTSRPYSQAALYRAALRDPRFSSGFGMYPSTAKPGRARSLAWTFLKFGFVGGLGLFLNEYIMYLLTTVAILASFLASFLGSSFYLIFAVLSSQAAVLVNFLMNEGLVFRGRKGGRGFLRRMGLFNAVSSADLALRLPLLWGLTTFLAVPALWSNLDSMLVTFVGRFAISEKKIWAKH